MTRQQLLSVTNPEFDIEKFSATIYQSEIDNPPSHMTWPTTDMRTKQRFLEGRALQDSHSTLPDFTEVFHKGNQLAKHTATSLLELRLLT
jgi:hypothetical protein